MGYRVKIPKISPGAYSFQRPSLRGLCTEGNLRFKIDWASLIFGKKFTVFPCLTLYYRTISKYKPPGRGPGGRGGGAYIWRGDLTRGFLRYESGGLIFGRAYFRNFTVCYGGVTLLAERSRLSQVPAVRFSNRSKIRPVPCELT